MNIKNKDFLLFYISIEIILILIGLVYSYYNSMCYAGSVMCKTGFEVIVGGFSLPIIFGFLAPILFYFFRCNTSTKKIILSSVIIAMIVFGTLIFIEFAIPPDYQMIGNKVDEEPDTFFNITQQQIEKFSCINQLVIEENINTQLSNDEFWKISNFFKGNNYPLGQITYIKYKDEFFSIEFDMIL